MASSDVGAVQALQQNLNAVNSLNPTANDVSVKVERQEPAVPTKEAAEPAVAEFSAEEFQRSVSEIGNYLSEVSRSIDIRVEQDLERTVVTILDSETGSIVRQIPSEEVIAIAHFIRGQQEGFDDQVALAGVILDEQS